MNHSYKENEKHAPKRFEIYGGPRLSGTRGVLTFFNRLVISCKVQLDSWEEVYHIWTIAAPPSN